MRFVLDQLQRSEDSAPDNQEFERLKEHFEPFIRASSASSSTSHHLRTTQPLHSNPITAAASDAISRDVPGVSKYNPLSRSRVGRDKSNRDEMPEYRSRMDVLLARSDSTNVEHLLRIENPDEIATMEQRWINSWTSSVLVKSAQSMVSLSTRLLIPPLFFLQRSEALADTPSFEEIKTVSDVSPYSHQTGAEAPVRAVQNQDQCYILSPAHGCLSPLPPQPRQCDKTFHQTRRSVGRR